MKRRYYNPVILQNQEFIVLEVSDTGIFNFYFSYKFSFITCIEFFLDVGVSEVYIPKLFQCFYRVQLRSHERNGIVLVLVQKLIHYGGDISVKFVVDQGSIFKVQLLTRREYLPLKQVSFDEEHEKA